VAGRQRWVGDDWNSQSEMPGQQNDFKLIRIVYAELVIGEREIMLHIIARRPHKSAEPISQSV
jgi:hypothetical protein